jgi:collagenase-like PrtC family protease
MRQILNRWVPEEGLPVVEVYGSLAWSPIGHGRASCTTIEADKESAIAFRRFLAKHGILFTYLLNAPFRLNSFRRSDELNLYLDWVLGELQPDALTISSLELMRLVRHRNSTIGIHVSTIAGVRTPEELNPFLEIRPNRVVPHHDLGKDWTLLRNLTEYAAKNGIEVEVLVTESCICQCPWRDAHYSSLRKPGSDDLPFHLKCNSLKLEQPYEWLMAGGAVRPEDITLLEEHGAHLFKLSGRDREPEWLPEVVTAYQDRHYEGNFIRLLDVAPRLQAEGWIYLDNQALEGFLAKYPQTSREERETHAKAWMENLIKEGNFRVEGTDYDKDQLNAMEAINAHLSS